jgi:transcription initiation factor IIE alpha subunit
VSNELYDAINDEMRRLYEEVVVAYKRQRESHLS